MESSENRGIIIRELRRRAGLSIQQASIKIKRSPGWLCEVENGSKRCRLLEYEFDRIVDLLDGARHSPMFKSWVANFQNAKKVKGTFDGAVLRFIRKRKEISLSQGALKIGISIGYLSKLESGLKPVHLSMRNKIMTSYGYSPSSFKNLATDPVRSQAVPKEFKFRILRRSMKRETLDGFFDQILKAAN